MGIRNYLIEGTSGSGKTTVATELERRGFHVVHGDRVLAFQGDPLTGLPLPPDQRSSDLDFISEHHIWDPERIRQIAADETHEMTFICGGSRNQHAFIHLFDAVFILEADWPTIERRLMARVDEWGSELAERAIVRELHASRRHQPECGLRIDTTQPLPDVIADILARCRTAGA